MQEVVLNVTRKKIIGKLGIILIIAAILLTFLSRTIQNALMPKVEAVQFVKGSLQQRFDAEGSIEFPNKYKVFARGSWRVEEVKVSANQQVMKGDLLAVVDVRDIELELKKVDLELLRLENSLISFKQSRETMDSGEYNRKLREKTTELELEKMEADKYKESLPPDGKILSTMDGLVSAVNIVQGMNTSREQVMFEITDNKNSCRVFWYMNNEKASGYSVGSEVNLVVTGKSTAEEKGTGSGKDSGIKSVTIKALIQGKEYLPASDRFKFWVDISQNLKDMQIEVFEGQKAKVWSVLNSQTYDFVLPRSAVTQSMGKAYIYVIRERPGALGMENYAEQREIDILDQDEFNVALNGYYNFMEKVIVRSSKPLSDGIQVHVR